MRKKIKREDTVDTSRLKLSICLLIYLRSSSQSVYYSLSISTASVSPPSFTSLPPPLPDVAAHPSKLSQYYPSSIHATTCAGGYSFLFAFYSNSVSVPPSSHSPSSDSTLVLLIENDWSDCKISLLHVTIRNRMIHVHLCQSKILSSIQIPDRAFRLNVSRERRNEGLGSKCRVHCSGEDYIDRRQTGREHSSPFSFNRADYLQLYEPLKFLNVYQIDQRRKERERMREREHERNATLLGVWTVTDCEVKFSHESVRCSTMQQKLKTKTKTKTTGWKQELDV